MKSVVGIAVLAVVACGLILWDKHSAQTGAPVLWVAAMVGYAFARFAWTRIHELLKHREQHSGPELTLSLVVVGAMFLIFSLFTLAMLGGTIYMLTVGF